MPPVKNTVAVKTEEKSIAPRPSPQGNGEIVDTRTGEVIPSAQADNLMDAQALAILSSGDLLAKLERAEKAKKEDFTTALESDFWKPGAPGTPEACIKGVFVGSALAGRILQHGLALMGKESKPGAKDGKPYVVRMNGGHSLTAQFKQVQGGDVVHVEYKGKQTTKGVANESGSGRDMGIWVVTKLPA